jgi:DNA-binding IclR family transcriptional regulator
MPETERKKILARKKVYFYWDPSRVDREVLTEELTRCRALGYAQDIGNITPGVNVVSAPLFANHEKLIGCLILIGSFAESKIPEYGPKVAGIARQISQKLGADVETIYPKQSRQTGG